MQSANAPGALWAASQAPAKRIARFLAVGALGTLIDVGLFLLLRRGADMPALPANILAYSAGIVNNYLCHRAWTYRDAPRKAPGVQFAQFAAVSLSALALNTLLVLRLGALLSTVRWVVALGHGAGDLLAKAGATVGGLGWNFLLNHRWTFAGPAPE